MYTNSQAILGAGSSIAYGATQNGSFTIFAETLMVPMSKPKVDKVRVTNNQSTNYTHEGIPGFIDEGDLDFTANYIASQQQLIRSQLRVKQWFQVQYSDGSKDTFYGWIAGVSGESPAPDQKINATFSIAVTGLSSMTLS